MARKKPEHEWTYKPQQYDVGLVVYPPIAMIRESAIELARGLASHLELTDIHMSDEAWTFRKPQVRQEEPRGFLQVQVEESEIEIIQRFPPTGLERFETHITHVVNSVEPVFQPQLLLASYVSLEYVLDIGGDSRRALLEGLGLADPDDSQANKLDVFGRPCHIAALRLIFPPYETDDEDEEENEGTEVHDPDRQEGDEGRESGSTRGPSDRAEWQATLTIRSLMNDPNSVAVEVDGRWHSPVQWSEIHRTIAGRVKEVEDFLKTRTTEFLRHFRKDD
jgi:hypothetical protein